MASSVALIAAAGYYIYDKRADARSQARSVRVEFVNDDERDRVKVHNFSESPILNIEAWVAEKPMGEQLAAKMPSELRTDPSELKKKLKEIGTVHEHTMWPVVVGLVAEDNSSVVIARTSKEFAGRVPGKMYDRYSPRLDFYLHFMDARGTTWRIDVESGKLTPARGTLKSRVVYNCKPKIVRRHFREWRVRRMLRKVEVVDTV